MLSAVGRVEVSARAPSGSPYRAIGVNVGTDRAKGLAFATVVYGGPTAADPRTAVTFRLDGQTGRLSLLPEAFGPSGGSVQKSSPHQAPTLWSLRFRAQGAHDLFAPDVTVGRMRGVPYVIRYTGNDIIAAVGLRPFDTDEQLGQLLLTPELSGPAPAVEGWQILVGRDAALAAPLSSATALKCLYPASPSSKDLASKNGKVCGVDAAFGTLKLGLSSKDGGKGAVPQPIFVYNSAGQAVFYTALLAGESVKVQLPSGGPYRLADTRSGRALKDIAALSVVAHEDLDVLLPPRPAGKIRLDPGVDRSSALVTVNRLDQPKGLVVTPPDPTLDALGTRLSPNTLLVKEWPFDLPLLTGSYVVEIARGGGVFCNVRVSLAAGESRAHFCPPTTFTTAIPALDADVAGQPHYLAVEFSGAGDEQLSRALGVDLTLPSIEVTDAETGSSARFVADDALVSRVKERWAIVGSKPKGGALTAFAKMLREPLGGGEAPAKNGVFELGCPAPALTLAEYEKTAKRLQVDALRLFGCATGAEQNEHLALAARVQKQRPTPIALTSVPAVAFAEHGLFFPRLFLQTGSSTPPDSAAAIHGLKERRYALGAGVLMAVQNVKAVAGEAVNYEVDVETASSSEVSARWLFVFSENGQRHRQALEPPPNEGSGPDDRAEVVVTHMKFKLPAGDRFIRVEVRGSSRRSSVSQLFDRNYGTVLATTSFLTLPPRVVP